jgi:large subunit ribosomal protein L18
MQKEIDRQAVRRRIRHRIRRHVRGTGSRPRVAVFRSDRHIYAQAIDDQAGRTLACASTLDPEIRAAVRGVRKTEAAKAVGGLIAGRLKSSGVEVVVFDRGGYLYHGRIRALAEAMRSAGLKF